MKAEVHDHRTIYLTPENDADEALLRMWDKLKAWNGGSGVSVNNGISHFSHLVIAFSEYPKTNDNGK